MTLPDPTPGGDLSRLLEVAAAAEAECPGPWRITVEDESKPPADIAFLDKHAGEERWVEMVHCSGGCMEWLTVSDHIATFDPPTVKALIRAAMALEEARDLLLERKHGNPARSAGHNARLTIESALSDLRQAMESSHG